MVQATVWEVSGRDGCAGKEFSGRSAFGVSAAQAWGHWRPGAERRRGPGLAGRCGATAQLVGVTDEVAVVGTQVVAEAEGGRPVTLAGLTLAGGSAG